MIRLLFVLTLGLGLTAQTTAVLRFVNLQQPESFTEAATVIRSVGEIRDVRIDADSRSVTFSGTLWQIDLAQWLFPRLDREPTGQRSPVEKYEITGIEDPVVRIFSPSRINSAISLQELGTATRSAVEIRRAFVLTAAKVVVMRGTPDEIAGAEWLFNQLDQPTDNRVASAIWRLPNTADGVMRVFYLNPNLSPQEVIESVNRIRAQAKIRRMFSSLAYRALIVRGTDEQLATADRLIRERNLLLN